MVLMAALSPALLFGQYSESLSSDRPGQTMSPNTVGKKALQFQFGYIYSDSDESFQYLGTPPRGNDLFNTSEVTGNNLNLKTRYGLFEKTEISFDFTVGRRNSVSKSWSTNADDYDELDQTKNSYLVGGAIRQNFVSDNEAGFNLGAELQFFGENYFGSTVYNLLVIVAANKQITDKLSIAGNAASFFNSTFYFTCNVGYSITDKLGVYAEYYPIFSNSSRLTSADNLRLARSFVNTGLSYYLSPNFMLDLTGGFLVSDYKRSDLNDLSEYNIQLGLTSRLDWRK